MKRLLFIACLILLIPSVASAHAELESSQPKQGETVKQSIDTLTLQFGEEVKEFTSFTVTNEKGESIPIDQPSISGKTVLVMTKKPLPNGSYTAKWEVMAADGHQSTGQLSFNVGQVEKSQAQTDQPAPAKTDKNQPNQAKGQSSGHDTLYIAIIIILIVIVAIGVLVLFRKKGK